MFRFLLDPSVTHGAARRSPSVAQITTKVVRKVFLSRQAIQGPPGRRVKNGLFDSRIREQRIRDCHGDLHLEHIHIAPTTLSIYDCIEFNDRFRCIDIANDVAFLSMDLDYHGRPDLSKQFSARMADALGDQPMLGLMDFYKCYRAYVRGKVESFHQSATGKAERERRGSRTRAERYFRLALRYAVSGSEPTVLVVMGRAASGKSTLARYLGRELGWEIFSSDQTRKALAGVPLYKRCGPAIRCRLYSRAMTRKTYDRLFWNAVNRVKEQRSLIVDATFSSRQRRDEFRQQLGLLRVSYCFIEAQASEETLKRRLMARELKRNEVSDARLEDSEALTRCYEAPSEVGAAYLVAVNTERPFQTTVMETLKTLSQRIPREPKSE
jgi:predicted kinase